MESHPSLVKSRSALWEKARALHERMDRLVIDVAEAPSLRSGQMGSFGKKRILRFIVHPVGGSDRQKRRGDRRAAPHPLHAFDLRP